MVRFIVTAFIILHSIVGVVYCVFSPSVSCDLPLNVAIQDIIYMMEKHLIVFTILCFITRLQKSRVLFLITCLYVVEISIELSSYFIEPAFVIYAILFPLYSLLAVFYGGESDK